MIRRFAVGTALVTGLTLSLTGCFGEAGDKLSQAGENLKLSATQVLDKAAQKTEQVDTFKSDIEMTMSTPAGDVQMSVTAEYQTKPELAMRMVYDEMSMPGQGSMNGMEVIMVGKTMYMKMPKMPAGGPSTPWVKFDAGAAGAQMLGQQSQQMDPGQELKKLMASNDVREVGTETVDGVETTRYAGTYKLSDAIEQLPADERAAAQKNLQQTGIDSMNFEIWVDDKQMPRKMTMKSPESSQIGMTATMTFRDFGAPVQISAPDPSQVTDMSEMLQGGGLPGATPRT